MVPGIIRPCIAAVLPKINGGINIVLDVGINPDPKADVLYQFAILGSVYGKHVYGIDNPKVGLLNIGEEEGKGNLLSQTAFQLIAQLRPHARTNAKPVEHGRPNRKRLAPDRTVALRPVPRRRLCYTR